ncbi:MAG: alkaline phosphatase family protein, partial [Thermoanaerobaculia bacterium]
MNKILKIITLSVSVFLIIFLIFSLKFTGKGSVKFIKKGESFIKLREGINFLPFKKTYSFKERIFNFSFKDKLYTNGWDEINSAINLKYKLSERNLPEIFKLKELEDDLKFLILNFSTFLYPEEFTEEKFKEKFILYLKNKPFDVMDFNARFGEEDIEKAKKRHLEIKDKEKEPIFTLFLGLDALDWNVLNPLIEKGRCPNFKKIMENGTYGEILSEEPMLSPILWTTIATGKSPQNHKILEFTQKNEKGEEIPITSNSRKCKALWNILSEAKRETAFLCWWVTDPPEWIKGILVSDGLSYQLFGISANSFELKKYISPFPSIELNLKLKSAEDINYEEIKKIININKEEYLKAWEEYKTTKDPHKNRINHLRAIVASTLNIHSITLELLKKINFSLIAPYFEGTDTAAHRFAQFLPPKMDWVKEEDFKKYSEGLTNFYIFIDGLIGEYLKLIPENSIIFIASDHGFQTGAGRPKSNPEDMVLGAPQWHRKTGVYIISGKDVKKGKGEMVSIKDIAPTLLYLQGLPVPEDMEGKVLKDALSEIIKKRKIEYIKTYEAGKERPEIGLKQSIEEVEERLKELKALGYISGAEEKKELKEESFTYYYNLANSYKFQGKRELAKLNYQRAVEVNPSFGLGYFELASLYSSEQDHQRAYENLKKAVQVGIAVPV